MDSLTQYALGSAIGIVVMRGRGPVWKNALIGGMVATLPDLDVFFDYGDPIRNMTYHRGESHAWFFQTLASPVIAWLITRLKSQRAFFKPWLLAVWLILITHATLDLLTVYGTQIGLPFLHGAYGLTSIFIIDPLYTVPLLIGIVGALVVKKVPMRFRWAEIALVVSTLYLLWGLAAQNQVRNIAQESLHAQNFTAEKILVTPTAFNSILWRIVALNEDGYAEGFYSFFDPERKIFFDTYETDKELEEEWKDNWYVRRMAWFTNGFYHLMINEGELMLSDLRMGQEPYYSFNFIIPREGKPVHYREEPTMRLVLGWVKQRALGNPQKLQDYVTENEILYKD